MPAVSDFAINDGAATPVAVTFHPESIRDGNATFRDDRAGVTALMPRIIVGLSLASPNRPSNRVVFRVNYPVKRTVDGIDTLGYTLRSETTFILPDGATAADRANLLAFHVNALSNAEVAGVVKDVLPIYGA